MSWEDYKKKKEQSNSTSFADKMVSTVTNRTTSNNIAPVNNKSNNISTNTNLSNNSNLDNNSWSKYKEKRAQQEAEKKAQEAKKQEESKKQQEAKQKQEQTTQTQQTSIKPTLQQATTTVGPVKPTIEQQIANTQQARTGIAPTPTQTLTEKIANNGGLKSTQQLEESGELQKAPEKKWYQKFFQVPDVYKDGQGNVVSDTVKAVGGTLGDIGLNIAKAPIGIGTSLGTLVSTAIADDAESFGDIVGNDTIKNWAKGVKNRVAGKEETIFGSTGNPLENAVDKGIEEVDKASAIGDTGDKVSQAVGYTASLMAGGEVLGAAGSVSVGSLEMPTLAIAAGAGSSIEDTLKKDPEATSVQLWSRALGSGALEGATEGLFGMFGVGGSGVDDFLTGTASKAFKSGTSKALAQIGVKATGEATEEFLNYAGNQLLDLGIDTTTGSDFKDDWNWEELGEQMAVAFVATGISSGSSTSINVAEETKARIAEAEKQGKKLTSQEKTDIYKEVVTEYSMQAENAYLNKQQEATQEEPVINENAQQFTEQTQNEQQEGTVNVQEQAKQEAQQIMEQINQEREAQQNAENEQKRAEIQDKINVLEEQLKPLQAQIEAENTVNNQDKISKLEQLRNETDNDLVREAIDNQITRLKTESQEMVEPTPAAQTTVENEATQNLKTITDEDITPETLNLTTEEQQELNMYEDFVNTNGVEALDNESKQRYEFLKRTEQNGNIAPLNNDVGITENTTDVSKVIKDTFGLNNKETKDLYNKVANAGSVDQVRAALEDYKAINEKVTDETVREIKNTIRNTKLDVSNLKTQITDYNDFRKSNFGSLRIGNDGMAVDSFYQELSNTYPDYFDSNVTNTADQVEALSNFVKSNKAEYTQQVGEISNEDLNQLANELYAEVHAKEYNKYMDMQGTNRIENLEPTLDQEQLKEEINQEIQSQVKDITAEIKSLKSQLNELKAPIKEAVKEIKKVQEQVKEQVTNIAPVNINENTPTTSETQQTNTNIAPTKNVAQNQNMSVTNDNVAPKVMNPAQIAELTQEDANTTPKLPNIKVASGNKQSSFYENITETSQAYNEEMRKVIANEDDVKYYQGITNEDTLAQAQQRLDNGGSQETLRWLTDKWTNEKGKKIKQITAVDVAEGWILLKRYQDAGDYEGAVQVAKKMREMGTTSGQAVQAFNIMSRLTPEGMTKYAQSELSEAFEQLSKNKTKEWIDANRASFDLTGDEAKFIADTMNDVKDMDSPEYISNRKTRLEADLKQATDKAEIKNIKQELSLLNKGDTEYLKKAKLAEIQQMMSDKIPPTAGQSIKAWMRISMLFNPKTQVRNVLGNAVIMPVNLVSDVVATGIDKTISKTTGVRTKGLPSLKSSVKGFGEGLTESVRDYQRGINTREMQGDRFEIKEGKNFKERTSIGKTLNRLDNLNSFVLDAGDRGFYNLAYKNSIDRQLKLNNTDTITQDMINIATNEALERTWQDNNNYTRFVLNTREGLNKIGIKDYGLGDVLIPFAKTPANLTKAIIDYSPVGVVNTITDGVKLKRSLKNGQFDAQMQHKFAQDIGKATAGTMLYVLGYALAQAGITSGGGDEDKDTKNFLKNVLGVNSYSIEIGGHSFTYDWAQPVAAPFAIMADIKEKQKDDQGLTESVISSMNTAGNLVLQQSFMESINKVLTNNDGIVTGLQEAVLSLPSRAIPTFSKQIADMVDGTTRQQFVADQPLESAKNAIIAKIPFASQTLAPSVNTLGNEIQKYGGENTIYNVFFNPSTVNAENLSEAGSEIYRVYGETKDKTVMPRVAPYSITKDDKTIKLTAEQRADFQKRSGTIVEDTVNNLLSSTTYQNMSKENQAKVLADVSNYAYNKAQSEVAGTELADTYKNVDKFVNIGGTINDYYTFTNNVDSTNTDTKKTSVVNTLLDMNITDQQKAQLYDKYYSSEETLNKIIDSGANFNSYLSYEKNTYKMEKDDEKKEYLRTSNMSDVDKTAIYETSILSDFENEDKYKTYKTAKAAQIDIDTWLNYDSQDFKADKDDNGKSVSGSRKEKIVSYINSLNLNIPQKAILIRSEYSSFRDYNNQIVSYVNSLDLTISEKSKILESLDMSVSNGRVSWK